MTSSYFKPSASSNSDLYDGRWSGPVGDVLVEVKRSSNARDARDALLALAAKGHPSQSPHRGRCLA